MNQSASHEIILPTLGIYKLSMLIHTFVLVGLCVRVAGRLSCLPPKQTPQVGSRLVSPPLCQCVTLGTFLDEHLLPFCDVPHDQQLGGEEVMVNYQ